MRVIAVVPARGGSKSIPFKNIHPLAGKPLLVHTIEHAQRTAAVDRVVVSTDALAIAEVAEECGVEVVWRPANISGDDASSESALLHALNALHEAEGYEPDVVVFLQATSPLRQPDDIGRALALFEREGADSLFSASPLHGFVWRENGSGLQSFSYDYHHRQRRQDAPKDYVENGSIYIFKPWVLRDCNNRLGGKIAMYVMDALYSFQIDEPSDLALMESLMAAQPSNGVPDLRRVRLLALDFDGVLTDNRALVNQDGVEAVWVHRGDGWGIARLREAGVEVVVLSTETNPVVAARCRKLQVPYIQSCDDKLSALQELARDKGLALEEIAFVGNDANDVACLSWVGHPIAVQDAYRDARSVARWVTKQRGGQGAVREVCDLILEQRRSADG